SPPEEKELTGASRARSSGSWEL
ncbi:rCG59613, partial [Rattus norvegicus]